MLRRRSAPGAGNIAATQAALGCSPWATCSTATAPRSPRARRRRGCPRSTRCSASPSIPALAAESRGAYRELYQALARMTQDELRGRTESLASSYLAQGVTFDFAGEERPFPLDAVPRVIDFDEWSLIERGVRQRVQALEAFLDDAYGRQNCVRDGVIPAGLIASSQYFYRQAHGIHSANGVRIQVSGNRPHPRRARPDARARRQCARSVGRLLRHLQPPGHGPDAARALRLDAGAAGRRLPQQAARGPPCLRPGGHRGAQRRRAHAGRLQLRLLRAHAPRAPHGRRARRGARPALRGRQGLHAHDAGAQARRRHLPPRRR